jgi:murein DD-endopeptidase MepM/ murein hydrolase activator NlpD
MGGKLKSRYKPLSVAVFLVGVVLLFRFAFLPQTGVIVEKGVLGGPSPSLLPTAQGAELDSDMVLDSAALKDQGLALLSSDAGTGAGDVAAQDISPDMLNSEGAIQDPGQPIGPSVDRSGLVAYTVRSGDNLSKIASYFGISVQTILDANPGVKASSLSVGETLQILPTSGVTYETKAGDTLASIATAFGISQDKITQFNPSVNFGALESGQSIIIPGGTDIASNPLVTGGSSLPNFNRDFIMPTTGYNWGILHHENAVDIANSCGTPVVAAAAGVVIPDPEISDTFGGWNGGYGNFVLIEHSFGNDVETRYAHLEKILVNTGDYVTQGQEIGLMGETGDATGCHLHFEVLGAQNPFAKS